jgi:RimJ/RimL family protein N-acetyltransferase
MTITLEFTQAVKEKEILAVYDHNIDAFSDSPDFKWNLEEIKNEIKGGWELYSVSADDEIVAALFLSVVDNSLCTKNTGLKMHHQGSGFSHEIKEFYEKVARERKLEKIIHYCRIDNFRMYSLNESHGYRKTENAIDEDGLVVEWTKILK